MATPVRLQLLLFTLCTLLLLQAQCRASAESGPSGGDLLAEELAELEDLEDLELEFLKANRPDLLEESSQGAVEEEEEGEEEDWEEEEAEEEGKFVEGGEEYEEEDEEEEDGYEEDVVLDEKDVVVLTASNFTQFVENNSYVLVEFYAPWCGHCQSLAPHYAEAATILKGEALLAKVDATKDEELAERYDVQGYPTLVFFVDGVARPFSGQRHREEIVNWIRKKIGPPVVVLAGIEDAQAALDKERVLVIALLDKLDGDEASELASVARQVDGVFFCQTTEAEVAQLFPLAEKVKAPALALLKKVDERFVLFEGKMERKEIAEFVVKNKLPLVITYSSLTSSSIFDSEIKKQLLWFVATGEYEKQLPHFQEAAKDFKGQVIFVHVNMSDEESSRPVKEFFGLSGDGATSVLAFHAEEGGRKYKLEGDINAVSLKSFVSDFLADHLKPFLKSDPVPERNDGDVKIVVGDNFDDVVLDETKDVLLEIYAPWCGHCQALEPVYEKLAKRLKGVESIVIAKMDGTTNEHYRAKTDGFPTLLFFPAGNKSFDPLSVDSERTVKAFALYLKKHAAIPFTIPKLNSSNSQGAVVVDPPAKVEQIKDEL